MTLVLSGVLSPLTASRPFSMFCMRGIYLTRVQRMKKDNLTLKRLRGNCSKSFDGLHTERRASLRLRDISFDMLLEASGQ